MGMLIALIFVIVMVYYFKRCIIKKIYGFDFDDRYSNWLFILDNSPPSAILVTIFIRLFSGYLYAEIMAGILQNVDYFKHVDIGIGVGIFLFLILLIVIIHFIHFELDIVTSIYVLSNKYIKITTTSYIAKKNNDKINSKFDRYSKGEKEV